MDALSSLANGFAVALTPINLMWSLVGVTMGTLIGILPGVGPALTIALLLPITYKLDPVASFVIFGGIYYGAMYGSSTTSILIKTPGETGSLITTIDGHQMALKGRAPAALATAAIGSFVAGMIGTMLMALLAPEVVKIALRFGPADYFALMCVAFVSVSALLGSTVLRGLLALLIGIGVGLIGIDQQSGAARFTFGNIDLLDGINIVVVVVGLFAVGEALYLASRTDLRSESSVALKGRAPDVEGGLGAFVETVVAWLRDRFSARRASGRRNRDPDVHLLPGGKAAFEAPEEFGHGAIEGVAGPEAANNSAVAGVLVPLLTLGIPTSSTAAIMLAAFQQYGIQPGPLLFSSNANLVWGIDREPVHRQRDAACAESSACRIVGATSVHSPPMALRGHSRVRCARRVRRQSIRIRDRRARRIRGARLRDAAVGLSPGAGNRRHDPRADGGGSVPPRHSDHPGRPFDFRDAADLADAAHHRRRRAAVAVDQDGGTKPAPVNMRRCG